MKKLISIIFTVLIGFIFIGSVHAAANVNITGLTVEDKTSTIDVNSYSYEGLGIKTDIFFNQVGDYVKFKITLKNNDNIDYTISDIQSNYQNEYTEVKYEYENNTKEFKANSSKVLFVTFRYTKEATNVTTLNGSEIKLTIPLDTLSNPKTGPDKAVTILLVGLALGFILFMYTRKVEIALSVFLAVSVFGGTIYLVEAAQELRIDINVVVTMDAPTTGKAKFDVGQAVATKMFTMADMAYSIEEDGIYMTCYNDNVENGGITQETSTKSYNNVVKTAVSHENPYDDPVPDNQFTCTDHILNIVRSKTIDAAYKNDDHKVSAADSEIPIYMWYEASNKTIYWYTEAPIAYLNEDASQMFVYLEYLTTLDLSDIRTRYTTDMNRLFGFDRSLTKLDLSNFDTSNVTDMSRMFYNMKKLESIDVSGFDTSNVEKTLGMFYNNRSLTSLDLSSWNTSKFENYYVFSNLPSLMELDISSFEVNDGRTLISSVMFYLPSLERMKTPKSYSYEYETNLYGVFTDGTNYYPTLDNSTPTSTWIERTNLLSFEIEDYTECDETNNNPAQTLAPGSPNSCIKNYNLYAEDGMNWTEWLNSKYNTPHISFINHSCDNGEHNYLIYEGSGGASQKDQKIINYVSLNDEIINKGIYELEHDICEDVQVETGQG